MHVLVVGATGATGKLLTTQLLERGCSVTAVARNKSSIPSPLLGNSNLSVIEASILDLTDTEMTDLTGDADAIASCLGHNLTLKGIYGHPRKLVTDTAKRLCEAVLKDRPYKPMKYVLMNTTANQNRDLNEHVSPKHKFVLGLIRGILPPHTDNEQAADYLRCSIGQNNATISWAAVRPDGLVDEEEVSDYTIHASPTRDPIFNAGKTSRINVAHFMADLIMNNDLWQQWKGQMPVIYNNEDA